MSSQKLRFAIFGNIYQAAKSASIPQILSFLAGRQAEILVEKEFYHYLTHERGLDVRADGLIADGSFSADFAISMGGDGTFLKSAHFVGDKGIPVLGVNMGRLGFLADVPPVELEDVLQSLFDGSYGVEQRTVIQVETDGEALDICPRALNDIAVLKRDDASMISIRASIDGEHLVTYQADGLIVSTVPHGRCPSQSEHPSGRRLRRGGDHPQRREPQPQFPHCRRRPLGQVRRAHPSHHPQGTV